MQDESTHNDTTISLKNGFKNIRRQTPTRPQKLLPETQVEKTIQDTKPEADFTILATRLKEINFTNMSNSAKQGILQKVTELQNKGHHRPWTTTTPTQRTHKNNFGILYH